MGERQYENMEIPENEVAHGVGYGLGSSDLSQFEVAWILLHGLTQVGRCQGKQESKINRSGEVEREVETERERKIGRKIGRIERYRERGREKREKGVRSRVRDRERERGREKREGRG